MDAFRAVPAPIASPTSTGGAGTFFEQHVDAAFLAMLAVRAIPPVLIDCTVSEVHFQTERLGWKTDDILVVGETAAGVKRKLLAQAKRSLTISAADDECSKAIGDFWVDFGHNAEFDRATDRFALVTLLGTHTLLAHFGALLSCAKASRDAADFEARVATKGLLNATSKRQLGEVRKIVEQSEAGSVTSHDLWSFLTVLEVLSFDLNTTTCHTEAQIKTLLAFTTTETDAQDAAKKTWNELLHEVTTGMPLGKSYQRADLPAPIRARHEGVRGRWDAGIEALRGHSQFILDGVSITVGDGFHIARNILVQDVLECVASNQVTLISGPAGGGKSAIAKEACSIVEKDDYVFGFRAVEFAVPHLDDTLQCAQIPASGADLSAMLAGQRRKLMLVESVERLLEATTREAFIDLLTLAKSDPSWKIVLTCRDYSADLVRSALLEYAGIEYGVIPVPPLFDDELASAQQACPQLERPFAQPELRELLRNPYILNWATRMTWSPDMPVPENERTFRRKFWDDIVRNNANTADNMPRRRQAVFTEVALRRAKALSLFAPCDDLDVGAMAALRQDGLIYVAEASDGLAAPSHDVLEDWAILRWIEEQFSLAEGDVDSFATSIGTYPAIRRTSRKWVYELIERGGPDADALFAAVIDKATLPAHFRDDMLVSMLRSPGAVAFLERHAARLFAADRQLLRRIIHLLRVGCMTTPDWYGGAGPVSSMMHAPDGAAWECVVRLIAGRLDRFAAADQLLLLGLVEDASRGANWRTPYPPGSDAVSTIAYWLLTQFTGYGSDEKRKRVLQVIAKLPNCDAARFTALLLDGADTDSRNDNAEELREIVLCGMEGLPACRDVPTAVLDALRACTFMTDDALRRERRFHWSELEPGFGLRPGLAHQYFPASAFHGPFLHLYRNHPRQAIDFAIEAFNHSADWYGAQLVPMQYVEPPVEIELRFEDGTTTRQWCNGRLWLLYRGMSVGPNILQCNLMALEQWLLDFAERRPDQLDGVLLGIVRRSRNVALTAVAAAVATAHPHSAVDTLLTLLRSRACMEFDSLRAAREQFLTMASDVLPLLDPMKKIYDKERRDANALPHRAHNLETAVANLQLRQHAARVHTEIDAHLAAMPPLAEQTKEDQLWRLALHRMDLRNYDIADDPPSTDTAPMPTAEEATVASEEPVRLIPLRPKAAEPDIEELVAEGREEFSANTMRLGLMSWGYKVFTRELGPGVDPAQWRARLTAAQSVRAENPDSEELEDSGPGFVAAVCIRDHRDELVPDEIAWCVDVICSAVERDADQWHHMERVQPNPMAPSRACAHVMPLVLEVTENTTQNGRALFAQVLAITHSNDEVRSFAASGVGEHMWSVDADLAGYCIRALAFEAIRIEERIEAERAPERDPWGHSLQIEFEVAQEIRENFVALPDDDVCERLDISDWAGSKAIWRIALILSGAPNDPRAVDAFERVAKTLVQWWNADHEPNNLGGREHSDDVEIALGEILEHFVLKVEPEVAERILKPIVDAMDDHPRNVSSVLQGIIVKEDRRQTISRYWAIWRLFADRIRQANWLARIDDKHPHGGEMLAVIFMTQYWKDDVRHWRTLEGHAHFVHELFDALPPSSTVLDNYVRFLYHIGEQSLPKAFERISIRLKAGDPVAMLRLGNTGFLLESLLRRHVYGRPLALKRTRPIREAVLHLLDLLVENGSSAAYRMRDDFVTPMAAQPLTN
ncbi:MAG: AAA family ATPase [Planctomycetaceae bacterium]|nr:AAA family ATPase [Planctomycetaceae bacterium]